MIRNLLVLAALALPLAAQFDNLVTTDDGATLLFQSQWRMAKSSDTNLPKIFRWNANVFTTVYSPPDTGLITRPSASNPLISGDGSITAYITFPGCAGAACSTTSYQAVISGATLPAPFVPSPRFQMSRNGRYFASGANLLDRSIGIIKVVTSGESDPAISLPVGGRFGIGNNGGILLLVLHKAFIISTIDLVLSTQPGIKIVNAAYVLTAIVSAAENRVVYEIPSPNRSTFRQLWSYEVSTAQSTMLEELDFGTSIGVSQYQPAISNDGARLLYRRLNAKTRDWEAVVKDYTAGSTTVIANILPSSNNFTISGDGKSAWLHRADGRLVRATIGSTAVTETAGRHDWIAQREGAAVAGSYNHLYGGGFLTAAPTDLTVDIAGLPAPILAASTQQLDIEIPLDAFPGNYALTLRNSSSPFESVLPINIVDLAPTFERAGSPFDDIRPIIVAHQDFRGIVTFADPAAPGEIVHLYMTGLGSVQIRPQCYLVSPFAPAQTNAPVLFAGLAPGFAGIYQVDVMIPAAYPSAIATIGCYIQGGAPGISGDYGFFNIK